MLDRLQVAVRNRQAWEAADLGLALLRAQAGPVYRVWLATVLPTALVLTLVCHASPWLAPLILWWLKPALDRPVLHVLATATFGPAPGVGETLRGAPGYFRRGAAATLLWRRFSPERSLLLPVWQLEQPDGATFRRRRQVLFLRGRSQAWLLTLVCLAFMAILALGVVAGLAFLWPGPDGPGLPGLLFTAPGQRPPWLGPLLAALPTLAMVVVEPCYVAAGFGLYLNRRVQLEGWDLELAFRQLGERARHRAARGLPGLGLVLVALLGLGAARLDAQPAQPPSAAKEALAEVLRAPEFATTRKVWRLRLRDGTAPEARRPVPPPAWLPRVLELLATLIKWLLPLGALLLLGHALWRHRRTLALAWAGPAPGPQPSRSFGQGIAAAGLPADLPGAARGLWDEGDPRAALALLYRGVLAHLASGLKLPLNAGSTETECLRLADGALAEPAAQYVARLAAAWQAVAYGGQPAAPGDRELCAGWADHFPGPGTGR